MGSTCLFVCTSTFDDGVRGWAELLNSFVNSFVNSIDSSIVNSIANCIADSIVKSIADSIDRFAVFQPKRSGSAAGSNEKQREATQIDLELISSDLRRSAAN